MTAKLAATEGCSPPGIFFMVQLSLMSESSSIGEEKRWSECLAGGTERTSRMRIIRDGRDETVSESMRGSSSQSTKMFVIPIFIPWVADRGRRVADNMCDRICGIVGCWFCINAE